MTVVGRTTFSPDDATVVPVVPAKPLNLAEQLAALRRVEAQSRKRLQLGMKLFQLADAKTAEQNQWMGRLREEQESFRSQVMDEVAQRLEDAGHRLSDTFNPLLDQLAGLDEKIERLHNLQQRQTLDLFTSYQAHQQDTRASLNQSVQQHEAWMHQTQERLSIRLAELDGLTQQVRDLRQESIDAIEGRTRQLTEEAQRQLGEVIDRFRLASEQARQETAQKLDMLAAGMQAIDDRSLAAGRQSADAIASLRHDLLQRQQAAEEQFLRSIDDLLRRQERDQAAHQAEADTARQQLASRITEAVGDCESRLRREIEAIASEQQQNLRSLEAGLADRLDAVGADLTARMEAVRSGTEERDRQAREWVAGQWAEGLAKWQRDRDELARRVAGQLAEHQRRVEESQAAIEGRLSDVEASHRSDNDRQASQLAATLAQVRQEFIAHLDAKLATVVEPLRASMEDQRREAGRQQASALAAASQAMREQWETHVAAVVESLRQRLAEDQLASDQERSAELTGAMQSMRQQLVSQTSQAREQAAALSDEMRQVRQHLVAQSESVQEQLRSATERADTIQTAVRSAMDQQAQVLRQQFADAMNDQAAAIRQQMAEALADQAASLRAEVEREQQAHRQREEAQAAAADKHAAWQAQVTEQLAALARTHEQQEQASRTDLQERLDRLSYRLLELVNQRMQSESARQQQKIADAAKMLESRLDGLRLAEASAREDGQRRLDEAVAAAQSRLTEAGIERERRIESLETAVQALAETLRAEEGRISSRLEQQAVQPLEELQAYVEADQHDREQNRAGITAELQAMRDLVAEAHVEWEQRVDNLAAQVTQLNEHNQRLQAVVEKLATVTNASRHFQASAMPPTPPAAPASPAMILEIVERRPEPSTDATSPAPAAPMELPPETPAGPPSPPVYLELVNRLRQQQPPA